MTALPESAMIFAAGFGTRMGDLVADKPKPMVPVLGRPMIDYCIDLLHDAGITRIVANTHYLHSVIAPHLERRGVQVSHEANQILDTGGGFKAALPLLGDGPVLAINPDCIWTGANPVRELLDAWQANLPGLLLLQPLDRATARREDGDFAWQNGLVHRKGPYVFPGAQIVQPSQIMAIEEAVFSFNLMWDRIIATTGLPAIVHQGGWCDIGHPEGLILAERMLQNV